MNKIYQNETKQNKTSPTVTLLDIIVFNIFLCVVATVWVRSFGILCDLPLVGFPVVSGELNTPFPRHLQIQSSAWGLGSDRVPSALS